MNKYIIAAAAAITFVFASYAFNFYYLLGFSVSETPEEWALLGDYAGGLLNPILTFISLVLLIKSLSLQNEANRSLRDEREDTRKTERLRSFEAQLFNMVRTQKETLDSFKLAGPFLRRTPQGVETFLELEKQIERKRAKGEDEAQIAVYLDSVDKADQIHALTRIFYNMVRMISEKLSDTNGFNADDRKSHYLTLINFTDFALLRLIMMSAQFLNYPSTNYLKNNEEFNFILEEVGLNYSLY